jgi:hypothetical protein
VKTFYATHTARMKITAVYKIRTTTLKQAKKINERIQIGGKRPKGVTLYDKDEDCYDYSTSLSEEEPCN